MLNHTAPMAESPLVSTAAMAPPATNQAGDDQAFAKALDRAAARQRDVAGDANEATVREGPRVKADAATQARASAERRTALGSEMRKTDRLDSLRESPAEEIEALPEDALPLPDAVPEPASQRVPGEAAALLQELAAWASSLPLPVPRPVVAAATVPADTELQAAAAAAVTATAAETNTALRMPDIGAESIRTQGATTPSLAATPAPTAPRQPDSRGARWQAPSLSDSVAKFDLAQADAEVVAPLLAPTQRAGLDTGAAQVLAALPGAWVNAQSPPVDGSVTLQAEVQPPLGSNGFAPALGSRLSVMVRDGIDHAQLKLNPAEMGPIEVRISLDGTQAQVDFSAAHALTRQALQDALPALAGALREQGLTLAGGGVFDQTREQRGDARPDGARGASGRPGAANDAAVSTAAAARLPRARGVVDLYA